MKLALGPEGSQVRGIAGPSKVRGSRIVAPAQAYAYKLARGRDLLTSWKDARRARGGARCGSPSRPLVCGAVGVLVTAGSLLGTVHSALASSRLVGSDYISRPLVLPEGVLRLDGGPRRPYSGGQVMPAGQLQFQVNRHAEDDAYLVP